MPELFIAIIATFICGGSLFVATTESIAGRRTPRWLQALAYMVFIAVAFTMFQHLIPGFQNIPVFDKVKFTPDAVPFKMYLNFDKTIVGLILFVFFIRKKEAGRLTLAHFKMIAMMAGLLIAIFIPLATIVGFVRFDPKLPELWWAWVLNNLFLVCFAEETLFRGFIQNGLQSLVRKRIGKNSLSTWLPVIGTAILFGAAHYRGGLTYVFLATIAGFFYGAAYQKSGKIAVPILVHFLLNAAHFFFFTYPALAAR